MKRESKLTQKEQEQLAAEQQHRQSTAPEFESVEAMLRHDALHTPVPPNIAYRLNESVKQLPRPAPRSWWRRLLGG